jgi:fumarylacetoacetase
MTKATGLDETHDPARRSFAEAANRPETDFPIQNLPLGVFSTKADTISRIGVAIGDQVFDLKRASGRSERLSGPTREALQETTLNRLFSLGSGALRNLRRTVADMLDQGAGGNDTRRHAADLLTPMEACTLHLPTRVSNYTDFYAGIYHARAAGALLTPENPLPQNYKWVPIAYHGRASSVQVGRGAARAAPAARGRRAAKFRSMRTPGFRARDGLLPRERQPARQADPDCGGVAGDRGLHAVERLVGARCPALGDVSARTVPE